MHHIIPEASDGSNDIDNALPLCFDCHSEVSRYNKEQPMGIKYKPEELKARREQIYEEFTRHLIPPVHYEITNYLSPDQKRIFPDVGFNLIHFGDFLPVRVHIIVEAVRDDKAVARIGGYYGGEALWNLNPRFRHSGHFSVPEQVRNDPKIRLKVSVEIIDQYDRYHNLLPVHFVYVADGDCWYFDP
ncbi:MAG: HNH endonuclease signature motif containing protein [Thermodesulfobacteriota bacterium]|nr:HNH endonuclease signature motif containing protein [Thermodesulfobacteriota bacterium]